MWIKRKIVKMVPLNHMKFFLLVFCDNTQPPYKNNLLSRLKKRRAHKVMNGREKPKVLQWQGTSMRGRSTFLQIWLRKSRRARSKSNFQFSTKMTSIGQMPPNFLQLFYKYFYLYSYIQTSLLVISYQMPTYFSCR